MVDLLTYRAKEQPNKTAYVFLHRGETEIGKLTYQELDRQARAIASRLQSLEATGERALLLYPPGLEFIGAFFGCLYAGVIAVPAYPPRRNQKMTRLQAIGENAQATVVLTTTALLENTQRQFADTPELAAMRWLTTDNVASEVALDWQKPTINSNDLAFLQYTSGSTGTPKGVMVTHGNLLHNNALIHQGFEHTIESQGVIWLPPYHDMGLIGGVLQPLYGGFPVALMSPVDFLQQPFRWLQAISKYRATTSGGPNFAYDLVASKITPEQLASLDLSCWEVAFTGAEPVRAETLERFAATFEPCGFRKEAFYPCYGMAETTLIVTGKTKSDTPIVRRIQAEALEQNRVVTAKSKDNSRQLVGCGRGLANLKVAIVDPKSLTALPDNQVGEIWVNGDSVAKGYWNRTQETEMMFNAYLADAGEEPYLRTGDLGFLQDGELFITGRIKDAIIIRGQNHYPQDIEQTVEQSHPALRPNCGAAFAVEVNGSERLVIVQEIKRSYLRKLNVKEVVESIRRAVTAEHNLQVYATVLVKTESIPKTSSGKIQRHACRAGFLAGTLNVVEDWSENPKSKVKFLQLQADVESVLEKLQTVK
ncbi:MAG: fatty acyl-AMP ligase [Hydrococcus sp. Prado102]|nr:fatty acyl-AMP ligase [Hydrococcus sp. Prado102]